jgi:hypothetical protein
MTDTAAAPAKAGAVRTFIHEGGPSHTNSGPDYQFVVRQYAIGKGHSVSVMWRGGEVDTIFGFEKEADALQWIKEKSQQWLLSNRRSGGD